MTEAASRVALTKTLSDDQTAVVTVTPIAYLHRPSTSVSIDRKEVGKHLGAHQAACPLAREKFPQAVAAIGPVLFTATEAEQITAVCDEVWATIPPDLDFARTRLVDALDVAEQEAARARSLRDAAVQRALEGRD
jgi:hypothetical protein